MKLNITHKAGEQGQFLATSPEGKPAGDLIYEQRHGSMVIRHTGLKPEFRGEGLGEQLLEAAAAHAREHKLTILPVCAYAKKHMTPGSKYEDVL